jgi:trans-aconitate methyltransferase
VSTRVVIPELLDHLPADDPEARRSRRDLRRINFFMGNERWVLAAARRFPEAAALGITELGAGDGDLTRELALRHPGTTITALDLAPPPPDLPENVMWEQGDLFRSPIPPQGGILIANLFLHHFEDDDLRDLGRLAEGFRVLIFCEPLRARLPHLLGYAAHPFINRVTRHDMHVSIDAGFSTSELPQLMNLSEKRWMIEEHSTWRGALRVLGCRT